MEWLIYLLCPLMMLFCMKGMFSGGKKDCNTKKTSNSSDDIKSLHMQVQILQEQNMKLMEDMKSLKSNASNVILISKTSDTNQKITS
ncbi:DUF2933 domain-containing protein [Cytobacillus oceanisediminis]|uniref:DUF2933 domain-containing protein n=1 Tax=Cytobacillus oceanisediminis TaxID=665099 RepID=UPI00373516AD